MQRPKDLKSYPFVIGTDQTNGQFTGDMRKFIEWAQRLAGECVVSDEDIMSIKERIKEIEDDYFKPVVQLFAENEIIVDSTKNDNLFITAGFSSAIHYKHSEVLKILLSIHQGDTKYSDLVGTEFSKNLIKDKYKLIKYKFQNYYILGTEADSKIYLLGIYSSVMTAEHFWDEYFYNTIGTHYVEQPYLSLEISLTQASMLLDCSRARLLKLIQENKISSRRTLTQAHTNQPLIGKSLERYITIYELIKYIEENENKSRAENILRSIFDYSNKHLAELAQEVVENGYFSPIMHDNIPALIHKYKKTKQELKDLKKEIEDKRTATDENREKYIEASVSEIAKIIEDHKTDIPKKEKITENEFLDRVKRNPDLPKRGIDIAKKIFRALPTKYRRGRGHGNPKYKASPSHEVE
ncbi:MULTISPECIES: hypothetical protein [unclassified Maridesulfovibrio]|uniref:hypothetical protein n=1 Tax=unclassified Maridesulfovibrio TaxID=2794999 RepID=UPI003B40872A